MNDPLIRAVESLTFWLDDEHWFPFVKSGRADVTGPGWQDKWAFANSVNHYLRVVSGLDDVGWTTSDDVQWQWVALDAEGEQFQLADVRTPGAIPVTCVWGIQ